jgi:hypothetical protein
LGSLASVLAQTYSLPLEIRQPDTLFNLQSARGVPLSTNLNDPPGSDGRLPPGGDPTANQFQGMVAFGALAVPTSSTNLTEDPMNPAALADKIGLPVGRNADHAVVVVLKLAQAGAPYFGRQVDLLFGAQVPAPDTDEHGTLLPTGTSKEDYWWPEPYTTNRHADALYYWSPHAGQVFATQPGPIEITWRKRQPYHTNYTALAPALRLPIGTWAAVASSADGAKLAAVRYFDPDGNGYIYTSTDAGTNWNCQDWSDLVEHRPFTGIASSADGMKLVAVEDGGAISTSADGGITWTRLSTNFWSSVASSADGCTLAAVAYFSSSIAVSTNAGTNWVWHGSGSEELQGFTAIAASADGTKLAAAEYYGFIYTSTNSGADWTFRDLDGAPTFEEAFTERLFAGIASSADGTKLAVAEREGFIYTSTNAGANWTRREMDGLARHFAAISSSADGKKLVAAEGFGIQAGESPSSGFLYLSDDGGATWRACQLSQPWTALASSADGSKIVAASADGVYTATYQVIDGGGQAPPGANGVDWVLDSGNYYLLYHKSYVVSGSAVKPPRQMYWTEKGFRTLGKPVAVPTARIGAVSIAYNNDFPRTVTNAYVGPGDTSPTEGNTNAGTLIEYRTFWYDQQQGWMLAYNREGRVFLELLGDPRPDGQTRLHLGFEIVDVIKNPSPLDAISELGEIIDPPPPGTRAELTPEPILQSSGATFAFQQFETSSGQLQLYATHETINTNDYLVHWMETGEVGLKWPKYLGRYHLVWPADLGKYSHYVRPLVLTEAEAKLTAVPLPTANAPTLEYQDPLDRVRGKLTENFAYYSFLDLAHPMHRALLRFTTGEEVAFERVFSWLDVTLKATNFVSLTEAYRVAHSNYMVASNLYAAEYTDYLEASNRYAADYTSYLVQSNAYVEEYAQYVDAYNTYLIQRSRGVNGAWKLWVTDDNFSGFGEFLVRWIGGWAVLVDTIDPASGAPATLVFTNSDGPIIVPVDGDGLTYPSTITVNGVSQAVTAVRVVFEGLLHDVPCDLDVFLVGPRGQVCALMSDAGGAYSLWNIDLTFDDQASSPLPRSTQIMPGSYQPTDYEPGESVPPGGIGPIGTSLAALLTPAPTEPVPPNKPTAPDAPAAPDPPAGPDFSSYELNVPRVVSQTVYVGDRISAPSGELGATSNYLAGYINPLAGTLFNFSAYNDPFVSGFATANQGAIIPVNASPGTNTLEVWWFRTNHPNAGANAANGALGFLPIYWPSVLGHYTVQWPPSPREIVLASKLGSEGSGLLDSFQAGGAIYYQNDSARPGYNPNEEHAIMSGGTVFATRDDLNITNGADYSSLPFVLVDYTANDRRPAMVVFKVLREKPEAGWVFDYLVPAGQLLQPPMPLPLLGKPVEGSGDTATNYNTEPFRSDGDLPGGWLAANGASGMYSNYSNFTYRDRHQDFWVYRGPHAGRPALQAGTYNPANGTFLPLPHATAVVGRPFALSLHASREYDTLALAISDGPDWLSVRSDTNAPPLTVIGQPATSDIGTATIHLVLSDLYDQSCFTNTLTLSVVAHGAVVTQGPLVISSTNAYTGSTTSFSNRPPFLALSPTPSNSFTMRYYYKTEASFAWPGVHPPPPEGSIVPYLRALTNGTTYVGAGQGKTDPALDIVYRPVWPVRDPMDSTQPLPTIPYGLTLSLPQLGLPGVRDWKTARVLYQQSIAADLTKTNVSVVLHDPTRMKTAALTNFDLQALPASVRTEAYQGKCYFPNLPPHLAHRLFFDPNRGGKGSLVLIGEFKEEIVGENYLLLNLLRGSDLTNAFGLCPPADTVNYPKWTNAIGSLATDLETFSENPSVPGTYIANTNLTLRVGVQDLADVPNDNVAVDSYALSATGPGGGYVTLVEAGGTAFTQPGDPVALHVFKVAGPLWPGELKVIPSENPLSELVTFQHTPDLAGRFDEYEYQWKIAAPVEGLPPDLSQYLSLTSGTNQPRYTLGGADLRSLGDNYIVVRYRAVTNSVHPLAGQWSEWTQPKLAEGWIKRVLAGINPFNQRVKDLFNNAAVTDASILTQAGHRWEGDIALNLDTINNYGLIEIYETVLRRGRSISIESGFNYGPANDALLLAAGYLNDLYMMLGNEAWADAANPTIGIGTANNTYGDIATALFAFKGQVPSLLAEELALMRGRDDFLLPGVTYSPCYNRLVWNYTRGIDAGEVIYALNYNIQENPNQTPDGVIDATDAARMFPQGHGDAYGHYLTALKGYYSLLMNENFDWVPRIEAVTVLGVPVSVDYLDERKFAAAATALARAGRQAFDLTWRRDYQAGQDVGWSQFSTSRVNTARSFTTAHGDTNHPACYWGLDHWASRTGQGGYINWVVGSAILPAQDTNPAHEGIQKIDRTTVPELTELATMASDLQTAMDNAEGRLTPLGLPEGSVALDINPNVVVGSESGTHFEQIYARAKVALQNAVAAFDDAKDVTRLMRSEQDSLAAVQAAVAQQELAYNNALIELYGTPYTDDIGPGKTYKQGYSGPDLLHYMYVETPESTFNGNFDFSSKTYLVDVQQLPEAWQTNYYADFDFYRLGDSTDYKTNTIAYNIGEFGLFSKPPGWIGQRASPGKIQQGISSYIAAQDKLRTALDDAQDAKKNLDKAVRVFNIGTSASRTVMETNNAVADVQQAINELNGDLQIHSKWLGMTVAELQGTREVMAASLPNSLVFGLATGGDMLSPARGYIYGVCSVLQAIALLADAAQFDSLTRKVIDDQAALRDLAKTNALLQFDASTRTAVLQLGSQLKDYGDRLTAINERARGLSDAESAYRALVAQGDRLQEERQVARQHTSAVVQGYRTRDAAFRIFRNEKLERYKTLFDLSTRYAFLAANAYDYETGLLNTDAGRSFVQRIVSARALGVVRNGEPQYAGSDTGDPGLSSALAEMKADWDVVKTRLGFNNPDAYGTTVSLRTENWRILPPGSTNDPVAASSNWMQVLHLGRMSDLLEDADVRRLCLQISRGDGVPVPGILLEFSTTITNGYNLFGNALAAGDHAFSPSAFATKIFGVGVAFEGYRGMDEPSANGNAGGSSPPDPNLWFLDTNALAATPYIYLIPVGVDCMRTPPLGDTDEIRSWTVNDVAVPLPFNIGASQFASGGLYLSSDSLTEPLFAVRKHQAFRPVPSASCFSTSLYGVGGTLQRSQYTNNRLIGRSVWNSRWKLVIPGHTMLNDPDVALDRFIQTVQDIKLHFVTYSYSGD